MKIAAYFMLLLMSSISIAQNNLPDIELNIVEDNEINYLQVVSQCYAPVDLYIKYEGTDSIYLSKIIEPFDSVRIFEMGMGDKKELAIAYNATYDLGYYLGDPSTAKHDTTYLYSLPFKKGKKYTLSQGVNGNFSHNNIQSRYAVDFQLEIGEPVHAARDGLVVKVVDHFNESGDEDFRYKANQILILHKDGTIASYVHLNEGGSLVNEGDTVRRGQLIGYSGNTGFTRGPHLHFVVRKGKDISVPVFFEGYKREVLIKRRRYKRNDSQ
ncbi:M23 family metallopeptidase [Ekhidna sp.]|uniref:M23 family metallopeptidase n=1 Tax=Ekhidna sp. TaxID=2608089 RepID=UPI00329A3FB5